MALNSDVEFTMSVNMNVRAAYVGASSPSRRAASRVSGVAPRSSNVLRAAVEFELGRLCVAELDKDGGEAHPSLGGLVRAPDVLPGTDAQLELAGCLGEIAELPLS